MDTGTVAGFAVCIHCAPVPNRLERIDPVLDHFARLRPIQRNHKAHTAGRVFVVIAIKRILRHPLATLFLGLGPVCIKFGHVIVSRNSRMSFVCLYGHVASGALA